MDGWITFGVDANTKKLEDKLNNLEDKYADTELELDMKVEEHDDLTEKFKDAQKEIDNTKDKLDELKKKFQDNAKQRYNIQVGINTGEIAKNKGEGMLKELDLQRSGLNASLKEYNAELEKATSNADKLKSAIKKNELAQAKLTTRANELNDKIGQTRRELEESKGAAGELGKGIMNTVKKVGKLALAVFGIRSAFRFITRSMSTISQYNDQIGTDLEYIRFALAMMLKPVVDWLINAAFTILGLIRDIIYTLTGYNIFENSGIKDFRKNMSSSASSAKEIKKSLAGFDEVNILDSGSSSSSGSGAGGLDPSVDLSKLGTAKKIDWWQWIKDNWKKVLVGITSVVGGILLFKGLKKLFKGKDSPVEGITSIGKAVEGFLSKLGTATIIIALLGGIALVIHELTNFMTAFAESGLSVSEVLTLFAGTLLSVAAAFSVMTGVLALVSRFITLEGIAAAAVILGGLALVIFSLTGFVKALTSATEKGVNIGNEISTIIGGLLALIIALTAAAFVLSSNPLALLGILALTVSISAILLVMAATLPTILDAVGSFITRVAPPLIKVIETISNGIAIIIKALGETLPPIIRSVGSIFNTVFNGINSVIKTLTNSVVVVLDKIIWFIERLGPAIEQLTRSIINSVTSLINFVISGIEYMVNRVIDGINGFKDVLNNIPGVNIKSSKYISIPRFTPRLASGGIINLPGRGVQTGQAIVGEAGREGVLPLTDNQTMSELGKEIGKWVSINNVIDVNMDSRRINRILQASQNRQDFASNV